MIARTHRLRTLILKPIVIVAWCGFLVFTKLRWIVVGPKVLAVCSTTFRAEPDATWRQRAIDSTPDVFMQRRATNRPRKALGGNWEVVYTDDVFVYYGRPHTIFGAGGWRKVAAFGLVDLYRVARTELLTRFPDALEPPSNQQTDV